MKLNYRETKPTVYKVFQLTFAVIRYKQLIDYIANSSNVPRSTVEAAVQGIVQAIAYFAINGHRVVMPDFGGFYCKVKAKVAQTFNECEPYPRKVAGQQVAAGLLKSISLAFAPTADLRDLLKESGTEFVDQTTYTAKGGGGN